jgi:hypothetical protein
MRRDHTELVQRCSELDKRMHQTIEYCREKCDDKRIVKLEDLKKIETDTDNKCKEIEQAVYKMKKIVSSLDIGR